MLLHIPRVLSPASLDTLRARLSAAQWADQCAEAPGCEQLAEATFALPLAQVLTEHLRATPAFFAAALPKAFASAQFERSECAHERALRIPPAVQQRVTDAGFPQETVRLDVYATIFLNAPADYEGGELLVDDAFGVHEAKLAAGDAWLYPASSARMSRPITRGQRWLVTVGVQSLVRQADQRRLLYDLDTAIQQLESIPPAHEAQLSLTSLYHNLLRQWSST